MTGETDNVPPPIREEMVQTAIKFLQNPNVVNTPLAQKQKFLQRKGLTDKEIQSACDKSGAYHHHEFQSQVAPPVPVHSIPPNHYSPHGYQVQYSFFDRIREIVHNIAIFSIVAYVIQKFYQRYIAPFLFGKKKSLEEAVDELDSNVKTSVEKIQTELESVKAEVHRSNNTDNSNRLFEEIKTEISSVKGLLLNRKQFPSVSNTPVVPPSIPAWQLSSVNPDQEEPKEDLLEDLGSGSGSSEPEHGMKTSESSLEIIYSSRDYDTESCHSKKSGKEDDND